MLLPTFADIQQAATRIKPYAHRTPVLTCTSLNQLVENFQKVGAFKFRGACNAVFALAAAEAQRGVATHSSGNHAAALALAARLRGIPALLPFSYKDQAAVETARAGLLGFPNYARVFGPGGVALPIPPHAIGPRGPPGAPGTFNVALAVDGTVTESRTFEVRAEVRRRRADEALRAYLDDLRRAGDVRVRGPEPSP